MEVSPPGRLHQRKKRIKELVAGAWRYLLSKKLNGSYHLPSVERHHYHGRTTLRASMTTVDQERRRASLLLDAFVLLAIPSLNTI
jgi:hypothetical protein